MKRMLTWITATVTAALVACFLCVCVSAEEGTTSYRYGEQIEIYVGTDGAVLPVDGTGQSGSWVVDDASVARIQNGRIIPVSEGFTYVTGRIGDVSYIHNVIVHSGLERITSVYVDGQFCSSGTLVATVGQTYQLAVDRGGTVDFSKVRVRISLPYADASAEDFVTIADDGQMCIWGHGEFDVILQSITNRQDPGYVLHVTTTLGNPDLTNAVSRYFTQNDYDLACSPNAFTKDELAVIDRLVFTSLSSLPTQKWAAFLPNLKTIVFDLSQSSQSVGCALTIANDPYAYELIGQPNTAYVLAITVNAREELSIRFQDFSFANSNADAFNASAVGNTRIRFVGKCEIKGGNASGAEDGYAAISAGDLVVELEKDATVVLQGGDGGSGSRGYGGNLRSGGKGISAQKLTIIGVGYSESTTLTARGGRGGNGKAYGEAGGNGGNGIDAQETAFSGELRITVTGGDGGNGMQGGNYTSAASSGGTGGDGKDGGNGTKGAQGIAGGSGGNGGVGLLVRDIQMANPIQLNCVGGNGGDGATGGRGQNGGAGGTGGRTAKDTDAGDGGTGGSGGAGGAGGNAGSGALALSIANENRESLLTCTKIALVHGYGGNPGSGGDGGNGGRGGNGGDDHDGGNFFDWEGPVHGQGGSGGAAGRGGAVGAPAASVPCYHLPHIDEIVATHPDPKVPTGGTDGRRGSSGSEGYYGDLDW